MLLEPVSHLWVTLSVFVVTFNALTDTVSAVGVCWSTKLSNGRCTDPRKRHVTREQCCALPGLTFYSEGDLDDGRIFYYTQIVGGYPRCSGCSATCEGVQCDEGKRCRLRNGRPQCVCSPSCSSNAIGGPVCGTNMRSYRSQCSLLRYNCRHESYVEAAYYGRCQVGSCDSVQCIRPGTHCVLDQNSLPHCVHCFTNCQPNSDPARMVCGADGITYESRCHASATSCLEGRELPIAYNGPCIASATCSIVTCPLGASCLHNAVTSRPQCVDCIARCPRGRRKLVLPQLCGTDNITYDNWCTMRQASCSSGIVIQTRHVGTCEQPLRDQEFYQDSSSVEA